ncbi:MAG: NAD(P)-dependent alcohol dehydrogenase [Terracidiphilus sp.]
MQAIVYHRYGSPDVLHLVQAEKPAAGEGEVLLRIHAAAVNPLDWHFLRGEPYVVRLFIGLRRPRDQRMGVDVAGVVEAVGSGVTRFKPGDAVFGACRGALAGYATAAAGKLAHKPERVTFEQAAAVPVAALTALQALRDKGGLAAGQRVLVNGAAGGVGSFAVQIARAFGARVAGVCSTRNLEMVLGLGAERAIDYTREDFTRSAEPWDLVLDLVGNHSLAECRRVLVPRGTLVVAGGRPGNWAGPFVGGLQMAVARPFVSQKMTGLFARMNQQDLETLQGLLEEGKVTPAIDRSYPLAQAAEAIRYLELGHARGKVVVTVTDEDRR